MKSACVQSAIWALLLTAAGVIAALQGQHGASAIFFALSLAVGLLHFIKDHPKKPAWIKQVEPEEPWYKQHRRENPDCPYCVKDDGGEAQE